MKKRTIITAISIAAAATLTSPLTLGGEGSGNDSGAPANNDKVIITFDGGAFGPLYADAHFDSAIAPPGPLSALEVDLGEYGKVCEGPLCIKSQDDDWRRAVIITVNDVNTYDPVCRAPGFKTSDPLSELALAFEEPIVIVKNDTTLKLKIKLSGHSPESLRGRYLWHRSNGCFQPRERLAVVTCQDDPRMEGIRLRYHLSCQAVDANGEPLWHDGGICSAHPDSGGLLERPNLTVQCAVDADGRASTQISLHPFVDAPGYGEQLISPPGAAATILEGPFGTTTVQYRESAQ